jgi:AAA domain
MRWLVSKRLAGGGCRTVGGVAAAQKRSISIPAELAVAIERAAAAEGTTVSASSDPSPASAIVKSLHGPAAIRDHGPAQLVVLCGLQASGKTTFRRDRLADHLVVSKDLMPNNKRKERRQRALIEEALAAGQDVVVDNTNPGGADRASLIELGRTYGAEVVGFSFQSVVADCVRRNAARPAQEVVPEVGLFDTVSRLTPPSFDEGFGALWFVTMAAEGTFEVSPWDVEVQARG